MTSQGQLYNEVMANVLCLTPHWNDAVLEAALSSLPVEDVFVATMQQFSVQRWTFPCCRYDAADFRPTWDLVWLFE